MPQASAVLKSEPKTVAKIDIGLDAKYCDQASAALTEILAANYRLLIKTHVYHWNVVGPLFKTAARAHRGAVRSACSRPPTSLPSGFAPSATSPRRRSPPRRSFPPRAGTSATSRPKTSSMT